MTETTKAYKVYIKPDGRYWKTRRWKTKTGWGEKESNAVIFSNPGKCLGMSSLLLKDAVVVEYEIKKVKELSPLSLLTKNRINKMTEQGTLTPVQIASWKMQDKGQDKTEE